MPNPPALTEQISIELDEQTAKDKSTCLLKFHGGKDKNAFMDVRCDFATTFQQAAAVLAGLQNFPTLQNYAAIDGGATVENGEHTQHSTRSSRSHQLLEMIRRKAAEPSPAISFVTDSTPFPVFCISPISDEVSK
jgi:hypothetical protein